MLREAASKLSRTSRIPTDRGETDNIPSKSITSNDIYPPGSKLFFRPVQWRSRRKRGMRIPTRKLATDVPSSNDSSSKWKPVTRPILARRKIFSSWNLKKLNSVLLVRRTERCYCWRRRGIDRLSLEEFLDIVQSQPVADISSENPALFHSEKTGRSFFGRGGLDRSSAV